MSRLSGIVPKISAYHAGAGRTIEALVPKAGVQSPLEIGAGSEIYWSASVEKLGWAEEG